jgi:MFS family permease
VFLFELGSLICGVAPSSMALIIGRAVAGLGVSGMVNGALSIIATSVEREKSPLYTGVLIGTAQMGECLIERWAIKGGLTD